MATPYLKSWTPNKTYEFDLRIGDTDYSNDLYKLSIRSSTSTPYQNFTIELFLNSMDLLTEEIYGQTPIKLSIKLIGETGISQEQVDFDLMFSETQTSYHMKNISKLTDQIERTPITLNTISRPSFTTMSKMVNSIYYNTTPEAIVNNVLSNTKAEIEYDANGKNTLGIDQFLIPPSSVYKTIKYLDRTYGVFNGMLGLTCSFDNKVKIQNLSKKIGSSQTFTVYSLATNANQEKILNMTDQDKFYTKVPFKVMNRGNSIFAYISPTNRYITKPNNQLSHTIDISTEDFAKKYGLITKNIANKQNIFYDSDAIRPDSRITYHTNQTGYNTDPSFINANLSRAISDVSLIVVELQHRLPILNLMDVGEAVNLIPQVSEYKSLGGLYVLKASEIGWVRSKVWETWARLYLMRTNISSN
jgi:hypothetical protein